MLSNEMKKWFINGFGIFLILTWRLSLKYQQMFAGWAFWPLRFYLSLILWSQSNIEFRTCNVNDVCVQLSEIYLTWFHAKIILQ